MGFRAKYFMEFFMPRGQKHNKTPWSLHGIPWSLHGKFHYVYYPVEIRWGIYNNNATVSARHAHDRLRVLHRSAGHCPDV